MYRLCTLLAIATMTSCSTAEVLLPHRVELATPSEAIDESALLDIAIIVFDPGVPEGELDHDVLERLIRDGVFPHIRRAESVQMAMQLRDALQRSGHWGSVWVAPDTSSAGDVLVTARILESDGYLVRLAVHAVDATGRQWIDEEYEVETAASAYDGAAYTHLDPYQDIFHLIANDLSAAHAALPAGDVEGIKTVGALRYAAALSPEAFASYVEERRGIHVPVRLPAVDDPMFHRIQEVRQRERLFLEVLDEHYEELVVRADAPYTAWRSNAREESLAVREATRSARWRAGVGALVMVASILAGASADPGSFSQTALRDTGLMVGTELLNMRAETLRGRDLHASVLEELSQSFDDEVKPMVVELEGVQHRLTGTGRGAVCGAARPAAPAAGYGAGSLDRRHERR